MKTKTGSQAVNRNKYGWSRVEGSEGLLFRVRNSDEQLGFPGSAFSKSEPQMRLHPHSVAFFHSAIA